MKCKQFDLTIDMYVAFSIFATSSGYTVPFRPIVHVTHHNQKKTFLFFIRLISKENLSAISDDFFLKIVNNWSKRYSMV